MKNRLKCLKKDWKLAPPKLKNWNYETNLMWADVESLDQILSTVSRVWSTPEEREKSIKVFKKKTGS